MNEVNPRLNSRSAGLALSASAVCYVFVSLVISVLAEAGVISKTSDLFLYLGYVLAPVALAAGGLLTLKFSKQKLSHAVPVKCSFKYYIIALLMIFGLLFAVSNLNVLTLQLLVKMGYTPKDEGAYLPSIEGGLILPALLVIAVLPAVFEEFLFRGVILNNLRYDMGTVRTVFAVGFCFALFHGSAEQTVYQFICGCAFALIAIRSGSIVPGVLMHFINNALIIVLYALGATDVAGNLAISQTANIILIIAASISFITALIWLIFDKKPVEKCKKGGVSSFFFYASVGILILAILWVASFFRV